MTRFYYLHVLTDRHCQLLVMVNGFPVVFGDVNRGVSMASILNEYMVLGDNELVVRLLPDDTQDELSAELFEVNVELDLRVFESGEVVTPEDGEIVVLKQVNPADLQRKSFSFIQASLRQAFRDVKATRLVYSFSADDYDFSALLLGASLKVSGKLIQAYALKLIKLFQVKDVEGFLVEYDPKVQDAIEALRKVEDEYRADLKKLATLAMNQGLARVPKQDDIGVRAWCNGRIYELFIKPGFSLIETNESEEAGSFDLPIFVSLVDERLKIVR